MPDRDPPKSKPSHASVTPWSAGEPAKGPSGKERPGKGRSGKGRRFEDRPGKDFSSGKGGGRKPFGPRTGGGSRGKFRPEPRDREGPAILYGWHTVKAALENPQRRFVRLLATENAAKRLAEEGVPLPIQPEPVRPEAIAAIVGPEAVHQGLLAEADPLPSPDISELPAEGLVLVLDQITDPHNVGAILRSAAAFAVTAVVTTARHSPEATGVLAKSASGALDYVPIVTVTNLARALTSLKENGWLTVGLDSAGDADLAETPLRAPLALVVGAEGKGLRQLTRTTCDAVARLDMPGRIKSLNVSNATVLALYVASTRIAVK
ncbi:23S rRNA (guanosine-2'-O-) -methyltransferase rlmB [Rhodovulum sp. PH10]|uniref:23S rRNA (guanosine(2251)-2'-O)-methyltransferase RlmB n=1 Tax=Rhodovulum sp. PH10 TaxID=1187851 RepID=UPI00027C1EF0|nr:23S rRNA (guanosine(2251)-2'-O)-methyltransferase RlmB [Rhodovulum sp. PH10]EJW09719.1 23S rRNA (guanosine-2'-O-) -methyltransferase rlmB [Rhodovulum sp. PH10]